MRCSYHLPLSPFCRKVRLLLAEKKLEVNLVEELVRQKRGGFHTQTPALKVPVLKIDGLLISESNAIFEYLEEVYPNPPLLPPSMIEKVEARRFLNWFDDTFHSEVTSKLLYQRVYSHLSINRNADGGTIKSGLVALRSYCHYLNEILEDRRWLAGNVMTIADFAGAAHISSLDYMGDVDWNNVDSLKNWYAKIKSRPAFRSILKDYIPTRSPPEHYSDLDF